MDKLRIAETLTDLRANRTRDHVASAIGISVSALAMYEVGARVPRDEIKKKLADFYGKTVQEIFFA